MTRPSSHTRTVNGKVLAAARVEQGLTQAQVAGRIREAGLYMDDSRVSRLELGKIPYPSPQLRPVITRVYKRTEAEWTAPCETCRGEWSPTCMKHPAGQQQDE